MQFQSILSCIFMGTLIFTTDASVLPDPCISKLAKIVSSDKFGFHEIIPCYRLQSVIFMKTR